MLAHCSGQEGVVQPSQEQAPGGQNTGATDCLSTSFLGLVNLGVSPAEPQLNQSDLCKSAGSERELQEIRGKGNNQSVKGRQSNTYVHCSCCSPAHFSLRFLSPGVETGWVLERGGLDSRPRKAAAVGCEETAWRTMEIHNRKSL